MVLASIMRPGGLAVIYAITSELNPLSVLKYFDFRHGMDLPKRTSGLANLRRMFKVVHQPPSNSDPLATYLIQISSRP